MPEYETSKICEERTVCVDELVIRFTLCLTQLLPCEGYRNLI